MAPPANRRSGSSRRAQYGTFFSYVAGVIGAAIAGLLLVTSLASPSTLSGLRGFMGDLTAAPAKWTASSRAAGGTMLDVLGGYFITGAETAKLRREVTLARIHLAQNAALKSENHRLKMALQLADANPPPVANAFLIASTAASTRRFATISAGSNQGVQVGMPVRSPLGLVGRVLEVGHNTARILLLADSESTVPVRRASDGIPAFASGRPDGQLQLRLISLGINPLKIGDAIVTSGSGGLFWPGTPVAVVTSLTVDGALARVLSDPAASEIVSISPAWNPVNDPSLPPPPPSTPPSVKYGKAKP
jgi:rod shape-determining protein MreC